jgi:hypothetical protein
MSKQNVADVWRSSFQLRAGDVARPQYSTEVGVKSYEAALLVHNMVAVGDF